jgi:hypothetical protein
MNKSGWKVIPGETIPPEKKNFFGRRPLRFVDDWPCPICQGTISPDETAVRVTNLYLPGFQTWACEECTQNADDAL